MDKNNKRITISTDVTVSVGDLRPGFTDGLIECTLTYHDKSKGDDYAIELKMLDSYVAETLTISEANSEPMRRKAAEKIAKQVFEEKHGIPYGIRSVYALQSFIGLEYKSEIDMQGTAKK